MEGEPLAHPGREGSGAAAAVGGRGRRLRPVTLAGGAAGGGVGLEGGAHQGAHALPRHEADLRPGFLGGKEEALSLQWSKDAKVCRQSTM